MEKQLLEQNLVTTQSNVLIMNARLSALENCFWGFVKADIGTEGGEQFQRMFYRFFLENLAKSKTELQSFLAHYPAAETGLLEVMKATEQHLADLGG